MKIKVLIAVIVLAAAVAALARVWRAESPAQREEFGEGARLEVEDQDTRVVAGKPSPHPTWKFSAPALLPEGKSPRPDEPEQAPEIISQIPPLITALPVLSVPAPGTPATPTPIQNAGEGALQDLAGLSSGGNSGSGSLAGLYGIPSRRGSNRVVATPLPEATATPAVTVLPRVQGQARGYAMLYLMQPEARAAVEREIETMLQSQVSQLYLGALVDGTFGEDIAYLESVVRRLNTEGRSLNLALYFTNGATQRKWQETPIDAPFVKMAPEEFRAAIRYDKAVRQEFKVIARRALPVFQLNRSLNPQNRNAAIVMLEDNLNVDAYIAMRDLAREELGDVASFIRNPCMCDETDNVEDGGSDGNTDGDPIEIHDPRSLSDLIPGDAVTLDGLGFSFPWEGPSNTLSVDELTPLLSASRDVGVQYFGLWRAGRQGLGGGDTQSTLPRNRHYEVQTDQEREVEVELLRSGLDPAP